MEQRAPSPPSQVNSAFLEDLVDLFFGSVNKYIVSLLVRQLSDWAYQLANGSYSRKIVLPRMNTTNRWSVEEMEGYRSTPKKQAHRELMIQGSISCIWGDYKVGWVKLNELKTAVELFFAASSKAKKDPYLEAGKFCVTLLNSL